MTSDLPRKLGLFDALSIVIGIIIGAGIFLVPQFVARELKSANMILAVWAFAGLISFFGALACAELGAALPATGGQYVFLREAFGPLAGFLYGWAMFLVAGPAQIAFLAMTLALYVSYFVPLSATSSKLLGLAAIAAVTAINYRGVKAGALVQKLFTSAKIIGLLIIIGSAFVTSHKALPQPTTTATGFSLSAFGVALIACLLAYDGWVQLSFAAGEIENPQRNVLLSLTLGLLTCIAIYMAANYAYLHVLSIPEIAASERVGATFAEHTLGARGGGFIALIILVSVLGCLNGCSLAIPRIYFAQARDGLFFRQFAQVHPVHRTPSFAILAQAPWAAVLLLSGTFESLLDFSMFAYWLSYAGMVTAVIVLRIKRPELPRPYRMWGYPVTAILFLAVTCWFLTNTAFTRPHATLFALLLIGLGVPVYFSWIRLRNVNTAKVSP